MDFTYEQQKAIDAQGRVIVSASAGSGKTAVMMEKICQLIVSGVGVGEILAVTFTKKAAAQMKEKLSKKLIEKINEEGVDEATRTMLKKQLNEVPSADISTIHSFCARLIRTHFYAANVDNAFRIISSDDAEGTALKSEALEELLEEAYEAQERDEDFAHLLSVYWRKKSDKALRGIFLTVYEKLRCRDDYKEYLESSKYYDGETFEAVCRTLQEKYKEKCIYYRELLENEWLYFEKCDRECFAKEAEEAESKGKTFNPADRKPLPQKLLCEELIAWLDALSKAEDYFAMAKIEKPKFTVNRRKKDSGVEEDDVKRLGFLKDKTVKGCEEEFSKLESKEAELKKFLDSARTAAALANYLLRFDEKYTEKKTERGVLDYNDLEHKALKLLSNPEIAEEVKQKYRYVFVDEYQDVNPVQDKIVNALTGERLFLVGDIKQAIYGFRGSESELFKKKQDVLETEGEALQLSCNFRSAKNILNAVNEQFSFAMKPPCHTVDYAKESLMKMKEDGGLYKQDTKGGRVQIYFLKTKSEEKEKKEETRTVYSVRASKEEARQEEISAVAKRIKAIIDEECGKDFFDVEIGAERKVKYKDIAILSRKKQGQIAATVAALAEAGVPVAAAAAVNICDYAEVKTLIDILSLLDNAEQDIPLCSALLSSMGGLTADELSTIRLAYKRSEDMPYFRMACKKYAVEKKDRIAKKLHNFYQYFDKIRALSQVLDAGELLFRIMAETRMEARFLSRDNGEACLKRIHRFIEESSNPEPLSVHGFLEHLRDLDYDIEYSENGGEDSVKVLTMHSSKGLEYPIVILDNLSGKFHAVDHDEVVLEKEFGIAPRAFDEENMTKRSTVLRRLVEVKEAEDSIKNEMNLYYVAMTRAKYGLHMIFEEPTLMPDVRYAKSYAEMTNFTKWEKYVVKDEISEPKKEERQALVFDPDKELTGQIMQAFQWKYPFAGYENLRVKSSATQLMSERDEPHETQNAEGVAAVGFGADESTKTEFLDAEGEGEDVVASGIAYHAFLEHFDFSALYDEDGEKVCGAVLEEVVESALARCESIGTEGWELLAKSKLVEILSNPVFRELRGMRLYPEQEFLVRLPVKDTYGKYAEEGSALCRDDGEEMIFQGAIDLLAIGEEVRVIDYKYSTRSAEELREHYMPQLELYRATVAKILKKDPRSIRCSIINIRQGFQVDMD